MHPIGTTLIVYHEQKTTVDEQFYLFRAIVTDNCGCGFIFRFVVWETNKLINYWTMVRLWTANKVWRVANIKMSRLNNAVCTLWVFFRSCIPSLVAFPLLPRASVVIDRQTVMPCFLPYTKQPFLNGGQGLPSTVPLHLKLGTSVILPVLTKEIWTIGSD